MSGQTAVSGPPLEARITELSGETLVELLDRAVARTPDAIALVMRRGLLDERWSYRRLSEVSRRVATTLRAAGVGPGERVLTWSPNDPWLVAAYLAVWRLGAAIVPLDLRMQADVAVRIGLRARAALLLAGPDVDPAAVEALGVPVRSVDEAGLDPPDARSDPPEGRACAPAQRPELAALPAVGRDDLAEVIFTSGTTSDPKGVMLTHGQIVHTVRALAHVGMGSRPDRALAIIPLSHMYGQTVPLLMGLMSGSTLVFLHALTPKAISATMQREHITAITLAPQLIGIILAGIEAEARRSGREASLQRARRIARFVPFRLRRMMFRSVLAGLGGALEVISSGGAMLSPELQGAWERFGVRIVQGYGTTEVAAVCGHSRRRQRAGTVGPPLAGMEVRIAPDGELLARGPNVMRGYWEAPEATAEVLDAQGWFHTGDAARIAGNGELVILGRTRDRIALPSGLNVYPEDVEGALVATALVRDAVVFEVSAGKLAAVLLPADRATADEELAAAVKSAMATLAPHQRVGAWRRWPEDDFPRTHTLKIRRAPVIEWFAVAESPREKPPQAPRSTGTPSAPATRPATTPTPAATTPTAATPSVGQPLTPEAVAELVASVLADSRGGEPPPVDPATTLASLDLDSLTVVSLALRLDEAYEAPLTDDEVAGAADIGALHALVLARQGQPPAPAPSDWAFSIPARRLRRSLDATVSGLAIGITARPLVQGSEHLEGLVGPVLVCPNHTSHLDAPVVRASLPPGLRDRSAIAAAADVWFGSGLVGPAVELALGAFPFGRTSDIRASLERVAQLVNRGFSVIIFPEGTRSADGRLLPLREGIGLLATSLRIPILPVHIEGAHEILPKGARLPSHRACSRVRVSFGPPLQLGPDVGVREATERVRLAIEALARP